MALDDPDLVAVAEDRLVLATAVVPDDLVLAGDEGPEVEVEGLAAEAGEARMRGLPVDPGGLDEVLRGQAAAVHAGAADGPRLGHHRGLAQLGGLERRGEGGRPGAEDHEVIGVVGRHVHVLPQYALFYHGIP